MYSSRSSMKTTTPEQMGEPGYWKMMEHLPAAIYTCDAEGRITNFNEAAVELWGRRPVIGKDFWCGSWKIYNIDGSPMALEECPMAQTLREGKPILGQEILIERPNGDRFSVQPHPYPLFDDAGILTGAINMLVDNTPKKEIQILHDQSDHLVKSLELLRRSEERYHQMTAEVQDYAIILLSKDGIIESWNRGAEAIKGYHENEILGKSFKVFYTPEDRNNGLPDSLIALAASAGRAAHEGWRVRKDGTKFWGSITITALHDSHHNVIGFSKVTRDLTERKIAEEKLMASSRTLLQKNIELERMNEELSSFAYISSHDLQEPLRKLQTFSDRIIELEYDNLSDKGKDLLRRMQAGALRMQTLIKDILAYSRTTTADKIFELTNLNELLAQSKTEMEVLIQEKKAVIESATLPTMKVIPFQIQQLFNNLLNNALKFSKDNIPPHIAITCDIVDANGVNARNPNGVKRYYHIAISDNGIGFEPQYEHKIFEVFQRLHGRSQYGGTGIGLAICKKIVENHDGIIRAQGRLNEGATFHLYLPGPG
jgi:PAS domain S-box-containing protein